MYKVRYKVGPRYGGGYWQTATFDNYQEAEKFRIQKCREGKSAEFIEQPKPKPEPIIDTSKSVERQLNNLFSRSDLGLWK